MVAWLPCTVVSLQDYNQSRNNLLSPTSDRVRVTMFPDSSAEGEEIPNTQVVPERQSGLQRMAQSTQIIRAAVQNLVNYQVMGGGRFNVLFSIFSE